MSVSENTLSQKVTQFMNDTRQLFLSALKTNVPQSIEQAVVSSFRTLSIDFGTCDYGFNFTIDAYVEAFTELIHDYLPNVLKQHLPQHAALAMVCEETNIAFIAYYALSLIYKKQDNKEELKHLMDEKYSFFPRLYPLAYEVRSRYYKRVREYDQALSSDMMAIQALAARQVKNYALGISFASTVCRMYEMGYIVEPFQRECAEQYICEAIEFKPDYPKYHFLRGKLLFYANRGIQDLALFKQICDQATECVSTASRLQSILTGVYSNQTWQEYQNFLSRIEHEYRDRKDQTLPFRHYTQHDFQAQIAKILESTERTAEVRPPNPNLKTGQKFFFVSYSHEDYKSVYCDLMNLYARKIPFQYDGGFSIGFRWDTEAHEYISKEECVGVIFFLSQHTLLSEAIERECNLALEASKNGKYYFVVNLENDTRPSEIMIKSIIHNGIATCKLKHVESDRMITFLNTFHDNILYIGKNSALGPNGTDHIKELVSEIAHSFPALEIPPQNATPI